MDSDLAWVNGKSGKQSWRYADAFQRSIISGAITIRYDTIEEINNYKPTWVILVISYCNNYTEKFPVLFKIRVSSIV